MKIYGEWRHSSTILGLGTKWCWVISFTAQSLYPQGKVPGTLWIGGWVGFTADLDAKVSYLLTCNSVIWRKPTFRSNISSSFSGSKSKSSKKATWSRQQTFHPLFPPRNTSNPHTRLLWHPTHFSAHCALHGSACFILVSRLAYSSTLEMEAICSSERWVHFHRTTKRYIPEDTTLHGHRCDSLESNK
jgi:hypothetical protein